MEGIDARTLPSISRPKSQMTTRRRPPDPPPSPSSCDDIMLAGRTAETRQRSAWWGNRHVDDASPASFGRPPSFTRRPSSRGAWSSSSHDKKSKESSEDKRRHIKSLIDKIPTAKNALFEYKVEWDLVDNTLMEKRIRPWVSKKIAEYIGEPEPTLSDFICTKVLAGSTPKAVLEDVQMVLDDEAEVFVVKLWRLLIYEIENKKLKATMATNA